MLSKNRTNYPIGSKIIVKDNSNDPYKIGFIKDWISYNDKDIDKFPLVDINGKEFVVWGIIRHFDELRNQALDKLSGIEQWNVLAEFHTISE